MELIQKIQKQENFLKTVISKVLSLTDQRSQESEVYIIKTTGVTISTRLSDVENIEFNDNSILKVTVFLHKKTGTASSNNLSDESILNVVDFATNIACCTSEDLYTGIADKKILAFYPVELDLCHPVLVDIKQGIQLASQAEEVALKYDRRIVRTDSSIFNSCITTKVFGNSHGMLSSYSSSQYSLSCGVIAEQNGIMEQNYAYTLHRIFNKLRSAEWVGQECARKALMQLGSRKIKTMESPVLFVSELATSLFHHLASAIQGINVFRKSTFLLDDLGKKIFPEWISIRELPHVFQELGSAPFDNEGVKTLDRYIIKNGILSNWLLDTYSARKIGLKSNGHAGGIYNWYIDCQNIHFMELVKNMHFGLIVTNIMGQGVNIVTGDYSRGVSGLWVENGEIKYPVNEITISGNLKKMFLNIVGISKDIETRSKIRCGSVLIDSMQIAGI